MITVSILDNSITHAHTYVIVVLCVSIATHEYLPSQGKKTLAAGRESFALPALMHGRSQSGGNGIFRIASAKQCGCLTDKARFLRHAQTQWTSNARRTTNAAGGRPDSRPYQQQQLITASTVPPCACRRQSRQVAHACMHVPRYNSQDVVRCSHMHFCLQSSSLPPILCHSSKQQILLALVPNRVQDRRPSITSGTVGGRNGHSMHACRYHQQSSCTTK